MATLKKYNLEGKEVGTVEVRESLATADANSQMVKDYIVAIRANARQWSACVKSRGEVSHTTKKPHPQKGTGNARQGSLVAPQFRGGGRAFGPKPKNIYTRINKKERQAAMKGLLAEKIQNNTIVVLENTTLEAPKTKTVANFLNKTNCNGRTLIIGEGTYAEVEQDDLKTKVSIKAGIHNNFKRSVNNIPKTEFALVKNISGYDIMVAKNIVITEAALNELTEWLC